MQAELIPPETLQAEREELAWLLHSGSLGRSANIARVLRFICEEHFAGRGDEIKEYTIAVEALGRRPDFDSQSDTIVRVTVHSLRKRLMEIYENEDAGRPFRVVIPSGRYVPSFLPNPSARHPSVPPAEISPLPAHEDLGPQPLPALSGFVEGPISEIDKPPLVNRRSRLRLWAIMGVAVICGAGIFVRNRGTTLFFFHAPYGSSARVPASREVTRALMGSGRREYVDSSGDRWTTGNFCSGGADVNSSHAKVGGTEDPTLYQNGVRGIAHCVFPVPSGLYEMHFLFAETTDLPPATRLAQISINAGPNITFDVVDEAGGSNLATSSVVTGVAPENDGAIHIDYVSEVSPLNAVEIVRAPSKQQLPVRFVAGPKPVVDASGQKWTSDRYFVGGRHSQETSTSATTDIYGSARVGRLRYMVPVVSLEKYRVRLYFRDPWFGPAAGSKDVKGNRVFDVECNGTKLLQRFDIVAQSGGGPVVMTFDNVVGSATGRLELSFLPVVNYPIVNAIEVTAQP